MKSVRDKEFLLSLKMSYWSLNDITAIYSKPL